jgi:site-specific recombinase XerD
LAAVDLPEQQFSDVRHYFALFLLAPGVPMRVVMATLGQSQMATTGDLYSQVVPGAKKHVADLLDHTMLAGI